MPDPQIEVPHLKMGDCIPRLLHQNYQAGEAALPAELLGIQRRLRAANPGWTYRFWDAAGAESFIGETYGNAVLSKYLRINPQYYAARSDLLRYLALYAYGGVYLDMKSSCRIPLDDAVRAGETFLLMSSGNHGDFRELAKVPNGEYHQWVIVTVAGHPFLKAVIERVLGNIDNYVSWRDGVGFMGTLRLTGPIAYTLAIHPIKSEHPFTDVGSPMNRGFVYSEMETHLSHRHVGRSAHYSALDAPLVPVSAVDTLIRNTILTANRLPGVPALRRSVRPVRQTLRVLLSRLT
jgi:mannosyltransferase OCH1-like enzyme